MVTWAQIKNAAGKTQPPSLNGMIREYVAFRSPQTSEREVYGWLAKRGYYDHFAWQYGLWPTPQCHIPMMEANVATKPVTTRARNPFEYGTPEWALFDHYQVAACTLRNEEGDFAHAKERIAKAKAKTRAFEKAVRAVTGKKCPSAFAKEAGATRR